LNSAVEKLTNRNSNSKIRNSKKNTQELSTPHFEPEYCDNSGPKKRLEYFPIHEIGRIDGGRGFRTGGNVLQIGGNTFYDRKNKIMMKILEFKRSGIRIIAEFRGILSGFPNQAVCL
jgi:hypothetical protein